MTLEQTLVEELQVVADVRAPLPPAVADLVRIAERERSRTLRLRVVATGLVAAAVVAAIVLGSQVGRPESAPQPVKPSPSYYAPGVPYLYKDRLYIDHKPQLGAWMQVESAGDHTLAVTADQVGVIYRNGVQVGQTEGVVYASSLSRGGTMAAWIALTGKDSGELVVRDLDGARDLLRLPVDLQPHGEQGVETSLLVKDDATTIYEINGRQWTWRPDGGDPVRSHRQPNAIDTHPPGFDGVGQPIRLSPDHLWGAWITGPDGGPAADVEGAAIAITVQKPGRPESRFTMPVPREVEAAPIPSWDSPTVVLLNGPKTARCDIMTRTCRVVVLR
jgi:hypothetical protein